MFGLLGYYIYIYIYIYIYWLRYSFVKIWNFLRVHKNLNTEKIAFKVVQMKSLAMHITDQKLRFNIFTLGNLQKISSWNMIFT